REETVPITNQRRLIGEGGDEDQNKREESPKCKQGHEYSGKSSERALAFSFYHWTPLLEQRMVWADFLYDRISGDDEQETDYRLIQSGSCGHAHIIQFHQCTIDVSIDRLGSAIERPGIQRHLIKQSEVGIEDPADI